MRITFFVPFTALLVASGSSEARQRFSNRRRDLATSFAQLETNRKPTNLWTYQDRNINADLQIWLAEHGCAAVKPNDVWGSLILGNGSVIANATELDVQTELNSTEKINGGPDIVDEAFGNLVLKQLEDAHTKITAYLNNTLCPEALATTPPSSADVIPYHPSFSRTLQQEKGSWALAIFGTVGGGIVGAAVNAGFQAATQDGDVEITDVFKTGIVVFMSVFVTSALALLKERQHLNRVEARALLPIGQLAARVVGEARDVVVEMGEGVVNAGQNLAGAVANELNPNANAVHTRDTKQCLTTVDTLSAITQLAVRGEPSLDFFAQDAIGHFGTNDAVFDKCPRF